MANDRARQKKLEKQKKKRDAARSALSGRPREMALRQLLTRAESALFGPAWASKEWRSDDAAAPGLVTVVLTRELPDHSHVAAVALIDRTCLGVKNGHALGPLRGKDLDVLLAKLGQVNPAGMESVDVNTARSIIHHAVAYAETLGFEPHPDFPMSLVGKADNLVDTPLAHPTRPVYLAEPEDDSPVILAQLIEAVGEGNYDVRVPDEALVGAPMLLDRYTLGSKADVEGVLGIVATLQGAKRAEGAEGIAIRRGTRMASAHVEAGALVVLAGDAPLLDGLRKELEAVLGDGVKHAGRESLAASEVLARLGRDG